MLLPFSFVMTLKTFQKLHNFADERLGKSRGSRGEQTQKKTKSLASAVLEQDNLQKASLMASWCLQEHHTLVYL